MAKNKNSGRYVDGFVLVVPRKNLKAYKKMAGEGKRVWMKHGALDYKECMGDDVLVKQNKHMPTLNFAKLTKLKKGETVWFSYIVYKSRAHRDQVNKKVMAEMNEKYKDVKDMPMAFDTKRMSYGGFKVVVG